MTEVLTINRLPVTDKEHPLATMSGVTLMAHLIESDRVWMSATKPQRALLAELCPPVIEVLVERGALAANELPVLPDRVTVASRVSMQRRGLVDDDGRLTGAAVHAWFYAGRTKFNGGDA